jgi:peptidyl-prolyl cis-trans isomerase D
MLQKIREKITGWVAWTILITIGLVFTVWGIDFSFTPRTVAARVNGEEVAIEPVRRAYQEELSRFQQAFRRDVPEEFQQELRRGVIEEFVRRELLRQRVSDTGYRVGDAELLQSIEAFPAFQVGGEFSLDAYRAALAGAGFDPSTFEAQQRMQLEVQQLQNAIASSTFVTSQQLERRVALERESREVEWVLLPIERSLESVEISDAQVEAHYQETAERWRTPETVDLVYVELEMNRLAEEVEVSDEQLREFYETEMAREPERYAGRERRRASHILLRTGDDAAEAESRAQLLRARLDAGEAFAELAKEVSEDPGSAQSGGDLGWVEPGFMVPAFEEALFAMEEEGTISGPVRTEFGWHLIRLEEIERSGGASFEEAREELLAEYRLRRAEDRFYDEAETLARLAFENADSLEPAASELGLEVRRIEGVTREGGPGIASNPVVIDAAWSDSVVEAGENSALLELEDGHAAVLRVVAHNPPELRPLQSVAGQIAEELRRERAADKVRELGAEARRRLEAGESVADIAEALSGDFVGGITVVRNDDSVPPPVTTAAFSAAKPAAGAQSVAGTEAPVGYYAVRVLAATPGGLELLPEEEQRSLRESALGGQASQELRAYLEHLRQSAKVSIFENALQ